MRSRAELYLGVLSALVSVSLGYEAAGGIQEPLHPPIDPTKYKAACPDYKNYAMRQQYVYPYQFSLLC